jgi:hypothetical protein
MVPYRTRKAILRAIKSGYQNSRGPRTSKKRGKLKKVDLVALVPDQNLLDIVVGGVGLQLVQPVLDFLRQIKNCQLN